MIIKIPKNKTYRTNQKFPGWSAPRPGGYYFQTLLHLLVFFLPTHGCINVLHQCGHASPRVFKLALLMPFRLVHQSRYTSNFEVFLSHECCCLFNIYAKCIPGQWELSAFSVHNLMWYFRHIHDNHHNQAN